MENDKKLKKMCENFSELSDEQKDYILGILQALVFANSANKTDLAEESENPNSYN
ncbi:MAG: hypothetical protein FWD26_08190 [Treponema sp.]|nr:hypothetical protein [Treponema sp.]